MQTIPANELLAGLTLAEPAAIHAVVTDSRKVEPGCVFVCFPGERVDGHAFAAGAYRNGAAYIIANHPVDGVPEDRTVIVPDSARAMIRMASNYRMLFSPKMIGVTGSVGKTTTKEFCYAVLSAFGKTIKTEGNQNNDIGVPNTLFRLDNDTRYAVVEMGMDHLGEIERLTRCARPSAGIITMIGVSHLENLGTRENILKAKMEICAGLPDGAPLALNADNDLLPTASVPARLRPVWFGIESETADVRAADVHTGTEGTTFTLVDKAYGSFAVSIPTAGLHTVYDALAAYAAATRLGLDPARCAAALSRYQTTGMRQHIVEKGGITFILLQRQPGQHESCPLGAESPAQRAQNRPAGRHAGTGRRQRERPPRNRGVGRRCGCVPADRLRPQQRRHGRSRQKPWYCNFALPNGRRSVTILAAVCPPRRCSAGQSQPCHETG